MRVGDAKRDWGSVRPGIEKILSDIDWLPYRQEDVYSAIINGQALLYLFDGGFAVFTIEDNPVSGEKAFLCWLAHNDSGTGINDHMDYFIEQARQYGCQRLRVKTPIDALGSLLERKNWRCDMREYSYPIGEKP